MGKIYKLVKNVKTGRTLPVEVTLYAAFFFSGTAKRDVHLVEVDAKAKHLLFVFIDDVL